MVLDGSEDRRKYLGSRVGEEFLNLTKTTQSIKRKFNILDSSKLETFAL